MGLSEGLGAAMAIALVGAYISGALDSWSTERIGQMYMISAAIVTLIVASLLAHLRLRWDDRPIGTTGAVSLSPLLDQAVHQMTLPLHAMQMKHGDMTSFSFRKANRRNAAGGLGMLRVAAAFTEQ
uniref:Uncharacterized protein n=1 Tax=Chrysotila carterae TaxID=13221 RepID=A0A7S4B2E5_CHRCT